MDRALPQVVEFDSIYDIHIERLNDASTRITAKIKPSTWATPYKKPGDLPFVRMNPATGRDCYWSFERSTSWAEGQARGEYFWESFVRYLRGTQKRRRDEAVGVLKRHLIPALFGADAVINDEAECFLQHLSVALVDSLRVGVES